MGTQLGLRETRDGGPRSPAGGARPADQAQEIDRGPEEAIRCRFCLQAITSAAARCSPSGSHRHTFANPHGIVFEIGCFRIAPGCRLHGPALTEFSWFSGYAWRIALCTGCLKHLGWRFQTGADAFFGLILDHLIDAGPEPKP